MVGLLGEETSVKEQGGRRRQSVRRSLLGGGVFIGPALEDGTLVPPWSSSLLGVQVAPRWSGCSVMVATHQVVVNGIPFVGCTTFVRREGHRTHVDPSLIATIAYSAINSN